MLLFLLSLIVNMWLCGGEGGWVILLMFLYYILYENACVWVLRVIFFIRLISHLFFFHCHSQFHSHFPFFTFHFHFHFHSNFIFIPFTHIIYLFIYSYSANCSFWRHCFQVVCVSYSMFFVSVNVCASDCI